MLNAIFVIFLAFFAKLSMGEPLSRDQLITMLHSSKPSSQGGVYNLEERQRITHWLYQLIAEWDCKNLATQSDACEKALIFLGPIALDEQQETLIEAKQIYMQLLNSDPLAPHAFSLRTIVFDSIKSNYTPWATELLVEEIMRTADIRVAGYGLKTLSEMVGTEVRPRVPGVQKAWNRMILRLEGRLKSLKARFKNHPAKRTEIDQNVKLLRELIKNGGKVFRAIDPDE